MKQHEISIKALNGDALHWLEKLRQVLLIQGKGKGTVKTTQQKCCCPKCKTGKME